MTTPERDPYTGHMTTGHEWNGIKELLTPVPKVVWFFLILSTFTAIVMWVLFPAWPYGPDYTRGALGVDQRDTVTEALVKSATARAPWEQKIILTDFSTLSQDAESMALTRQHGARLFSDNCAVCHGANASGGGGYPSLIDKAWLWGGDPEDIMETLRVGINTQHEDTRNSQMMAFGETGILSQSEIWAVTEYVESLSRITNGKVEKNPNEALTLGREIFEAQCVSCHGESGLGKQDVGAPNLADAHWIYDGNKNTIYETISKGRMGVMPHWDNRLSLSDRKILALYVLDIGESQK